MALFPITIFDFPNVSAYDSDLRELIAYWRKLSEAYNVLGDALNDLDARFTQIDNNFADLSGEFKALSREFKALSDKVDGLFDEVEREINNQTTQKVNEKTAQIWAAINELRDKDVELIALINKTDGETRRWVLYEIITALKPLEREIAAIQKEIDELQFKLPDIMNPAKGYETPLFNTLWDMWDALRYEALTCGEYDALGLTCGEYDNESITCLEYDVHGKTLLNKLLNKCRNPFTGLLDTACNIFAQFAALLSDGLTCGEYDALELTCGEYDAKELSAYNYDWNGKNLLP